MSQGLCELSLMCRTGEGRRGRAGRVSFATAKVAGFTCDALWTYGMTLRVRCQAKVTSFLCISMNTVSNSREGATDDTMVRTAYKNG